MKKNTITRLFGILVAGISVAYTGLKIFSIIKKDHEYDEENNKAVEEAKEAASEKSTNIFYSRYLKRFLDVSLSLGGLIVLAPVYGVLSLAIVIDDPGPVLFTQKRVGIHKTHFNLHKFRSMKMCTPHDTPTHLLENPEQYITRVGKFLRKYSLDELPQIWDIFIGNMSIIGPRPALWNQSDLIEERDKYGANDIQPGLTGWAQINGRDELEIDVKAKLDGDYAYALAKNSFSGLKMDVKCFFGTIHSVANAEGVVEGGTGELKKKNTEEAVPLNSSCTKSVMITGAGSYIGTTVEEYIKAHSQCDVKAIDMIGVDPETIDFSGIDVVFHVAGIVHQKETEENRQLYYDVNCDQATKTAECAKKAGVGQFIILSTMSVYGLNEGEISFDTVPTPVTHYGKAKLQADTNIQELRSDSFKVCIVRPPMVYGNGCKGNYQTLRKFSLKSPVFPSYKNTRSMIYIENLASVIMNLIDTDSDGLFLPQDKEYICSSDMVKKIGSLHHKKVFMIPMFNFFIRLGKPYVTVLQKVFGNLTYAEDTRVPDEWLFSLSNDDNMKRTEKE